MNFIAFKKLYPDLVEKIENRYDILKTISSNQPIGRRNISNILSLNERYIRNEIELLSEIGYIKTESIGMSITNEGNIILNELEDYIYELKNLDSLARQVKEKLNIKNVIISTGSFQSESGKNDLGKTAAKYFMNILKDGQNIGITGGSTMGLVVDCINTTKKYKNSYVVAARGSLGGSAINQSNLLAIQLSEKLNASYSSFYLPDNFNVNNDFDITKFPDMENTLEKIDDLDVLLFGIGDARKLAFRRKLDEKEIKALEERDAVAEAFGNYFDILGNKVYESYSIGINIEQYKKTKEVIAVAGDDDKEEAIIAISSIKDNLTLIITELCAKNILIKLNSLETVI